MQNFTNKFSIEESLLSPAFFADPYPFYHWLRVNAPVYWNETLKAWIVTCYNDVASGLRNPYLSAKRDDTYLNMLPKSAQEELQPLRRFYSLWLMFSDPPDHTRIRGTVNKAFTPKVIERLKPSIQRTADELLYAVKDRGRMDVLGDFAFLLPVIVIAEMLGVPSRDYHLIKRWSDNIVAFLGTGRPIEEKGRYAQRSLYELMSYFEDIIAERRRSPKNDLLSSLIFAEEQGKVLNKEELLAVCANLLVDGHEPIANLIGNGLVALLNNPDQLRDCLKNGTSSLIETTVEELLRYNCPFQYIARQAKEDIKIGNQQVKQHQRVLLMIGAANRDPEHFSCPDQLDIGRQKNKHLAFGLGAHYCVGAALGRITAQIAINTLIHRLPKLELRHEELEWHQSLGYRGLKSLHITW